MTAGLIRTLRMAAAVLALAGCREANLAGGGSASEDTNGSLVGRVAYADGRAAAGASVIVRPRAFLKDTAEADRPTVEVDAVTDSLGRYRVDSLVPGAYVVEIRDGRDRAYLETGNVLPAFGLDLNLDTLRSVGSLEGSLQADSGAAGLGYVQIYGLDRVARTDSAGRFVFPDLPAGQYTLRPVSSVRGRAYPEPEPADVGPGDTVRVGVLPVAGFESEDYARWPQSRNIHLNTAATGLLDSLADYPLLVRLHAGNFDFGATSGRDIRFSDEEGRHLAYEVDRWDSAGRRAEIWVKLPVVRGNSRDQFITLYWGNPGAPDFSNGRSVFGAYAGVWHMGRRTLGPGLEEFPGASPTASPGKIAGTVAVSAEEAAIGKGAGFSGNQMILAPGNSAFRPRHQLALSGWIRAPKTDVEGGEMVSFGNNYGLRLNERGEPYFYLFNDSLYSPGSPLPYDRWKLCIVKGLNLRDNAWHHMAAVWDGSFMRVHVDGREKARTTVSNPLVYPMEEDVWMGRLGYKDLNHDYFGILDEVRIAGEAWPEGKVRLDFESQKPGSTFLEFR